jgi:holliday junction DNA helicase RuvA
MYAYIKGLFTYKAATVVHVEAHGVGYELQISLNTFSAIQAATEGVLYTWLHVKEDGHTLYGFAEEKEKETFLQLISVSGIGANTARVILSSMRYDEVQRAIASANIKVLESIKGIGKKTAERMVLELKDKLAKQLQHAPVGSANAPAANDGFMAHQDVVFALMALGIQRNPAEQALAKVLKTQPEVIGTEALIKAALKQF